MLMCRNFNSSLGLNIRKICLSKVLKRFFRGSGKKVEFGLLTLENMNQKIRVMEYAVRGPLLMRALEIENELASGVKKPFDKVIKANLGDCHAMGQQPITFYRQVLALVSFPELIKSSTFPSDVTDRAKELLSECRGGSVGSYSESTGILALRKHVANSIKERDGVDCNFENIMLSSGATEGIKNVLKVFNETINHKLPGVMIPIPQYPLYSATLTEFGMVPINYFLQEDNNWAVSVEELQRSYNEVKDKVNPRLIVVINPGNPTGQVLTKKNIEDVIKFAHSHNLVIMADEVYQANVYAKGCEFHSFKKVANEMGPPYSERELASFMSCSKGYMGECGLRGGYCELINVNQDVMINFNKCISANLCPTTLGQCLLDCVVRPPKRGDPSYELFEEEKNEILQSLKEKATMVYEFFNSAKGFSCNEVQGSMYAFPKIDLPPKALEAAKKKNLKGDQMYAFELLENTGVCIIPGSGFQQMPGTYHFRTTILPKKQKLIDMLKIFETFHLKFLEKYS